MGDRATDKVFEIVRAIEKSLREVYDLQEVHVKKVCPVCETSCCSRVTYLFNDKDVLFLRLSGQRSRWSRKALSRKGCWFLGEKGCTIAPCARPFICHTYLCDDLKNQMDRHDPGLTASLEAKFRAIGELRTRLWREYLDHRLGIS